MIDIVRHRHLYFLVSALLIIPGLISLLLPGGLRPGIDFTSGSILTVRFGQPVDQGTLRQAFAEMNHPEAIVQRSNTNSYIIRTFPFAQTQANAAEGQQSELERVMQGLSDRFCPEADKQAKTCDKAVEKLSFDHVSPLIANEIVWKSAAAVGVACLAILGYLWWAFRKVPLPWRYGSAAVLALVHDALFVLGAFSLLGRVFGIEVDAI